VEQPGGGEKRKSLPRCRTITCNYDGFQKYATTIENGAFIGSDSILVAPIKIGKGAYTGAGSVMMKDVPPNSLAIARAIERHILKLGGE
jgi:bifunctional UDP-N-acetylglucosamine pyrophosphorylase/glucosamine-1-phosphate N-acetyltransferase